VPGLKLLLALLVVVNHAKALGKAATELGLEAKDDDPLLVRLVQGGELLAELGARDVGAGGVKDGDDKLLAVEQTVGDELGGSDGNRAGGVLLHDDQQYIFHGRREQQQRIGHENPPRMDRSTLETTIVSVAIAIQPSSLCSPLPWAHSRHHHPSPSRHTFDSHAYSP
jgi:hypothetical protein